MSVLALAPSIRAPAAADEAFQARLMSLATVASRRISAAVAASCTALLSSACAAMSSSGGLIAAVALRICAVARCSDASAEGDDPDSALMASSTRAWRRDTPQGPAPASPNDHEPAAPGGRR